MKPQKNIKARFKVEQSHFVVVKIDDHKEQLSWFHSVGGSVNIIVTQKIVGDKLTKPRVVARLTAIEGEVEARALYLDYARRHGREGLKPFNLPLALASDLSLDHEIEAGDRGQLSMIGAPR